MMGMYGHGGMMGMYGHGPMMWGGGLLWGAIIPLILIGAVAYLAVKLAMKH